MDIKIIDNLEKLLGFSQEWERLFKKIDTNIFLSFEWISLWCKHLCKESRPLILAFKEDNRFLGIAPLMVKKEERFGLPIRKIEFLGRGDADRLDFIIPDRKEKVLRELIRFFLKDYKEWDILEFSDVPDFSSTKEILGKVIDSSGLFLEDNFFKRVFYIYSEERGKLPYIPSLTGLKKDFRKARNRILRLGFEPGFEILSGSEEIEKLFFEIVDIENKSWLGRAGTGMFNSEKKINFHNELLGSLSKKNMVEIAVLRLDRMVAYTYDFRFDSVCQGYNMAYLPKYSHLSPGLSLIYLLIEDFFKKGGREFDFLKGDEPWKHRWTNLYRKHFRIRIFNKNPFTRILYLGERLKDVLRHPIKRNDRDV